MKKHILITGGAGFIGSHLGERLVFDLDYEVTCIDNFDDFYARSIKEKNIEKLESSNQFHFVEADIRDKEALQKLIGNFDAIVHIAAKAGVLPSIKNPLAYEDVNIKGTFNLLEFARERKIKQFVFASSSSVYGVNKNVPWSERDFVLQPISPYAATKVACELAGHTYSHLYGIRFIGLRFFTVFGPRQRPDLAIHKFAKKMLKNEPITVYGDGSTKRDYTYVSDIVDGIIAAMSYTRTDFEIINIGNNKPVTLMELIHTIETVFDKKAIIKYIEEQPGDVPITFADISKGKALLDYSPKVTLQEGLQLFKEWFLENK